MIDRCIFCGYESDDFDPEHWIPHWLSRALIPKHGEMVMHHASDRPAWKKRYFDLTVKHVCKTCNGGWMSDIEANVREHALQMILGDASKPISEHGLKEVANWCFLKVISLELGRDPEHHPTYPARMYEAFRQTKHPPHPGCSLALGYRNIAERNPVFVWFKSQGQTFVVDPSLPPVVGYHTTLVVGHLVIDVFGSVEPVNLNVEHGEGFCVLWPTSVIGGRFSWPAGKRFEGIVNDELI